MTKTKEGCLQIGTNIQSVTEASKQESESRAEDVVDRPSEKLNDLTGSDETWNLPCKECEECECRIEGGVRISTGSRINLSTCT